MIKNQKQYKISKKSLEDINQKIVILKAEGYQLSIKKQLILISLEDVSRDLEKEIVEYDLLRKDLSIILKSRTLSELPYLIIEYKIASGLTQKEFSEKAGMKEQQLQRYEAEDFQGISFRNLLRILHAIGLEVTVRGKVSGSAPSIV